MTAPPATSTVTARRSKRLLRPSPEMTPTPPPPPPEKHMRKETEADDSHAIAGLLAIAGKRASREYLQLYRFHVPRCRAPLPAPPAEGRQRGGSRQIGGEKVLSCFSPSHSCSNEKGGRSSYYRSIQECEDAVN